MIYISEKTTNLAWEQCIKELLEKGETTNNEKYYRDELVVIEILEPCIEMAPSDFPILQKDLDIINNYIITGENEESVIHEWTKLYYHRIYDEPNSQFNYFLDKLKQPIQSGKAQISFWEKKYDQDAEIAPCTQIIWGRVKEGMLEMHVHAHSVDAYKKLILNQQEFISFQAHVARQLGVNIGKFYHIIDSCHIYTSDIDRLELLNLT
jgi:thymidylate synthase